MKEKIKCSECEFANPYARMETVGHLFAVNIRISIIFLDYFQDTECRKIQDSWIMERPGPMRFR